MGSEQRSTMYGRASGNCLFEIPTKASSFFLLDSPRDRCMSWERKSPSYDYERLVESLMAAIIDGTSGS